MPSNYDQPFREALEYFTSKGYELNPGGWAAIAQEANAGAFTVARVAQMDILEDIKGALEQALNDGLTYQEFADNLIPTLEQKGWLGAASRLGVIFETNLAAAYNVGRWTQIQQLADERPFLQYRGIRDSRTRKLHLANFGKTYRVGDPFWAMWYPPNGFRCRCYVVAVDQGYLDANKLSVSSGIPADDAGKQILPDIGFRYNVGEAGMNAWKPYGSAPIIPIPPITGTAKPIESPKMVEPKINNILDEDEKLQLVTPDKTKLLEAWKKDPLYVAPDGTGSIAGRIEGVKDWIAGGNELYAPEIVVDAAGRVMVNDGRHTLAVLSDIVKGDITVAMSPESITNAKKFGLL